MKNIIRLFILSLAAMSVFCGLLVFSTPVHAAVITAAGNGNWNSTTNNAPWPNGIVPLSTDSVVIPSSRAVTVTTAATCAGVTVNSGATLSISNGITLTVNGDVAGTGTINTGTSTRTINISGNWTFTGTASGNGLVVVYNGTGTQTLTGSSVMSVTVNKASGELQLLSSKTIRTLLMTQGTFNPNGFLATISTFTFNGGTLIVPTSAWSGSYSRTTAPAAGTTVIYNRSGTQTVNGITYSNLTLSGGSAKTTTGATINGILSMEGTATTTGTAPTYGASATLQYKGSGVQTTGNEFKTTLNNLIINNSAGVVMSNSSTIGGALTLTSGKITTGANTLTISSTGSVSGGSAGSYVVGNLQKWVTTGAASRTFEVGAANYNPLAMAFANVTAAGYLTIKANSGQHSSIGSSHINSSKDVAVYWGLSSSITFTTYDVTMTFTAGDIIGGANTANFIVGKYNSGWAYPSVGTKTATTTQATGLTTFCDLVVGEPTAYTLTYTAGANGSISGTSPQSVFYGSSGAAVTAVPNTGYHFVNWSDASTANPRTDTNVTANINVTANFAVDTFTLTYTAGLNGSVTGTSPQTVNYSASGSAVTAVPNTGYHFVNWSDASTANPRTDTNVSANISVTANFAIDGFTLTYNAGANGSISGATPQSVSYGGDGTEVIAVPDTGYHFVQWSDSVTTAARTDTNITADKTVTATFAINTFDLTASAGANGSISPSGIITVDYGMDQTFNIAADIGYDIADVLVDGVSQGAVSAHTFTNITANHTISASFQTAVYTIAASATPGGSISPSGSVPVNYGADQAFNINVNSGHFLTGVFVDGAPQGAITSYNFTNVTANHTISATFDFVTYTISASAGPGGTISPSGNTTVNEGNNQAYTITPNLGYIIDDVLVDGVSQGAITNYTFTNVTAAHTISASFSVTSYTVTAAGDSGGTITPVGVSPVNYGANLSYSIAPDPGYYITNVVVDGVSQGAVTIVDFLNITSSHTIYATFYTTTVAGTTSETITGAQTGYSVNATAAQTNVTVNTNATVDIDVLQYAGNPHPEAPLPPNALPRFNDIIVSDANAVIWPMYVEIAYTDAEITGTIEPTLRMYYFQGNSWHICSNTGVNETGNFVWAYLTEAEALGSPLTLSGDPLSGPTAVGGNVYRIDKLQVLLPWLSVLAFLAVLTLGGTGYFIKKRRSIR